MSHAFYHLQYIIPVYFGFAVLYDLFTSIYGMAYGNAPLPWEPSLSNGVIVPVESMPAGGMYANDSLWYTTENPVTDSYVTEAAALT